MIDKQIKRTLFFRTLLEHFGITWKLEVKEKRDSSVKYRFFPIFKHRYMFPCKSILSVCVDDCDAIFGIEYIDYLHDLSVRALNDFVFNARLKNNNAAYNNVLNALNRTFGKPLRPDYMSVNDIDFNDLIQNMILDGIDLNKFPKIEDVL